MGNIILDVSREEIKKYTSEFFLMEKGTLIRNPEEKIPFTKHSQITRKSLKHIVESRVLYDKLNLEELISFILRSRETIENPEVDMGNLGNKKYPNSRLLGKFDQETNKGIMVILDCATCGTKNIITIFRKEARNYFRLLSR